MQKKPTKRPRRLPLERVFLSGLRETVCARAVFPLLMSLICIYGVIKCQFHLDKVQLSIW